MTQELTTDRVWEAIERELFAVIGMVTAAGEARTAGIVYIVRDRKLYIGTGVSGGEEGALKGPSIMPGGSPAAWPHVKEIFQAVSAKVDDGAPCCDWVGENGAGHYVKMVHNGVEYGLMAAYAEGLNVLAKADIGTLAHDRDAETARSRTLTFPGYC